MAYREVVGREQLQEIANAGLAVLSACHQRRAVRLAESVVEEYDEEVCACVCARMCVHVRACVCVCMRAHRSPGSALAAC